MIDPVQNRSHIMGFVAAGQCGSVDHDHRDSKGTGGQQLGLRAGTTRVFGNGTGDAVTAHQRKITLGGERAAIQHDLMIGKGQRSVGRIDQAQQIEMLRVRHKFSQMHPADGQKDTLGRAVQRGNGTIDVGHMGPVVLCGCLPRRAGQCDQRCAGLRAGDNGIVAHLRGKGMRRVNHVGDAVVANVTGQAIGPAKPARALRQRLADWSRNTACQRYGTGQPGAVHCVAQGCGLGRAAKDQGVDVHG